jgi:uncharacterized MnhB-related membrane protein
VLSWPHLFKAVALFNAFELVMALAWVRLNAPDVPLAETAMGAGLWFRCAPSYAHSPYT